MRKAEAHDEHVRMSRIPFDSDEPSTRICHAATFSMSMAVRELTRSLPSTKDMSLLIRELSCNEPTLQNDVSGGISGSGTIALEDCWGLLNLERSSKRIDSA